MRFHLYSLLLYLLSMQGKDLIAGSHLWLEKLSQ
jgi:hypothetical protein